MNPFLFILRYNSGPNAGAIGGVFFLAETKEQALAFVAPSFPDATVEAYGAGEPFIITPAP